jgi:asparagine synthase (glutamine-hydrolysing)
VCGIAGWYRRDGRPVSADLVEKQCDAILHRGPDDWGAFLDGDLGMGMRRLSIVDIAGGHQPMTAAEGRYAIVYNGEIYNHLELRPELEARGARFTTRSDTETALAAFVHWGAECWGRFDGMYAAAIFDRKRRVLTLARDPLGIKPLFCTDLGGGLAFASEIKALKVLPRFSDDIDERAVHDYFRFGHILRPRTIYRSVRQLDPGCVLEIGPEGEARTRRFWTPKPRPAEGRSERDWIEEARARVLLTVKRHLLSDVPVGSFLSGGVDSAAVTAAMAMQSATPVTAFTIGFPGNPLDESAAAKAIADHLGCRHVLRPVDLMEARDVMPAVQAAFDEPSGASAAIPTWYVAKLAREHVKVVLCGEGGDELFSGYKRHLNARRAEAAAPLLRALRPAAEAVERLPAGPFRRLDSMRRQARRFRQSAMLDAGFQRFIAGTEIAGASLRKTLFADGLQVREERSPEALEAEYRLDASWAEESMLQQFMLGDLTLHMPSALLGRLDRASMAHSLEARVPFLSQDFVDWTFTVPLSLKAKGVGKYLLREAARPWLPEFVFKRRKQGFQMPLKDWFRGDFSEFARESWFASGAADAGYLKPAAVDALFTEHRQGRADHGKLLYAISMFACWQRDRSAATRPRPEPQTLRAR